MAKAKPETESELITEDSEAVTDTAQVETETAATEPEAKPKAKTTKAGPKSHTAEEPEPEAEIKTSEPKKGKTKAKSSFVPAVRKRGKNYRKSVELVDRAKLYELTEAIELAKQTSTVKFDATLELHMNLGIDPKQADQTVRLSLMLPAGTGKTLRVAAFVPAAHEDDAKKAGADLAGADKLMEKIEKGELNFDVLITTPDMMPQLAKLAKILGPKGLMPNPKSGTVTTDVTKAISEAKKGKVEIRTDKQGIVHQSAGKISFKNEDLRANLKALILDIQKAKPTTSKGTYVKAIALSTSMGPGIRLDVAKTLAEVGKK